MSGRMPIHIFSSNLCNQKPMRHFPTSPDPGGLSQGGDYVDEKLKVERYYLL